MHNAKRTAQTLLEYAVIISIVMAAFVAMQVYIKRGVQGRVKDLADNYIGEKHYASGLSKSEYKTEAEATMRKSGSAASTDYEISETSDRAGKEYLVNDEEWLDKLPVE